MDNLEFLRQAIAAEEPLASLWEECYAHKNTAVERELVELLKARNSLHRLHFIMFATQDLGTQEELILFLSSRPEQLAQAGEAGINYMPTSALLSRHTHLGKELSVIEAATSLDPCLGGDSGRWCNHSGPELIAALTWRIRNCRTRKFRENVFCGLLDRDSEENVITLLKAALEKPGIYADYAGNYITSENIEGAYPLLIDAEQRGIFNRPGLSASQLFKLFKKDRCVLQEKLDVILERATQQDVTILFQIMSLFPEKHIGVVEKLLTMSLTNSQIFSLVGIVGVNGVLLEKIVAELQTEKYLNPGFDLDTLYELHSKLSIVRAL